MKQLLTLFLIIFVTACQQTLADATTELEPEVRFLAEDDTPPSAKLTDMNWFVGLWEGEVFGGTVEHRVMTAHKGHMPGLVRVRTAETDDVSMYELSSFIQTGETITYRNRHFGADLIAYQEPYDYVDRPLIAIEGDTAYFDGITFASTGENSAVVAFVLTDEAGVQTRHLVQYTRR